MRQFFSILILITILALPAGCSAVVRSSFNAEAAKAVPGTPLNLNEITCVADNGAFSLWVDAENAAFEIRGADSTLWRSLPEHFNDPDWVNPMLQNNIASILSVTALDPSLATQVLPSYEMCVKNGTVSYESIPDGARFIFRYEKQGFTIPLDICLTKDGFTATIPSGSVIEDGDWLISQMMILPYFNSGTSDDDGFLFYPDGSGAIASYSKDYNNVPDQTQSIYGFDRGIGAIEIVTKAYGYRMPVYGAKTNNSSYLAVIEGESSFISAVQTGVARGNNRYFKNGAVFTYRDIGKVLLKENQTTVNISYVIPAPVTSVSNLTARYILMDGSDIRYTDMAFIYRDYLEKNGVLEKRQSNTADMHLSLIGSLVKPSSFLGIPMERQIKLTTLDQAREILNALSQVGINNTSVRYAGAQKSGYNGQWTRDYKFSSSIGDKKRWDLLVSSFPKSTFFLNGELLQIYKNGQGYSISHNASRTTGNGINYQNPYSLLDGTKDGASRKWTLLAPSVWADTFSRFGESATKISTNLSLEDAGSLVYSEYNLDHPAFRDQTGPALVNSLKELSDKSNRFALTDGYAYTWGIADTLYSVPLGASNYFIQSDEVPFYQMVIHGYIEYSGEPMNLSPDATLSFLRSIEYGALPHYAGIYTQSSALNRSVLEQLFSACYLDWLPNASYQVSQSKDFWQKISGALMVNHEKIAEGVYRTTYDNGVSVTVDYNELTFSTEGVK